MSKLTCKWPRLSEQGLRLEKHATDRSGLIIVPELDFLTSTNFVEITHLDGKTMIPILTPHFCVRANGSHYELELGAGECYTPGNGTSNASKAVILIRRQLIVATR